jgi:hypothetical protein
MSLLLFASFVCLLCLTPFVPTFAVISSHCGPSRVQPLSPFGPTALFVRLRNFQTSTAPVPRKPTSTKKASDSTVLQSYCARIVPLTYAQYELQADAVGCSRLRCQIFANLTGLRSGRSEESPHKKRADSPSFLVTIPPSLACLPFPQTAVLENWLAAVGVLFAWTTVLPPSNF